jgi:hypothetical protein
MRVIFQSLFTRIKVIGNLHRWFHGLNKEFWLGNIFVMLSTVLGVYLAANSGLKTAMEFERISSDRDNYYLRANLRDEVMYNVAVSEEIITAIDKVGTFDRINHPAYQHFVMDTMKEQSNTLKTPNKILTGILRYNEDINSYMGLRDRRYISYPELADKMRERIKEFRASTLSLMEQDLSSLKLRLDEANVAVY